MTRDGERSDPPGADDTEFRSHATASGTEHRREPDRTRRSVLRAAAGGVAAAGALSIGGQPTSAQAETFELLATAGGWEGRAPAEIEGETNPTLSLEPETTYVIEWENDDGLPHALALEDVGGEQLLETEVLRESDATQAIEFEATEELAAYYCTIHPASMRGSVSTNGVDPDDAEEPTDGELPEDEAFFSEGPAVGVESVVTDLTAPRDVAIDGDGRLFVAEQTGELWVVDPADAPVRAFADGFGASLAIDVGDRLVDVGESFAGRWADPQTVTDERGLLGVALHPDVDENGLLYLHYSAPPNRFTPEGWSHRQVVSEFQLTNGGSAVDPDSERVLLMVQTPQFDNNAGSIAFGPDGYLYVPMGDGGGASDAAYGHVEDWYEDNAGGNGQDTTDNGMGGVHRIDVDGRGRIRGRERPYDVPDDNPLVDEDDHIAEYYAWGFRNPSGIAFDEDGRPIVADVGKSLAHEVNVLESGGNYGWNVREGTRCFDAGDPATPVSDCPDETPERVRGGEPLRDPVLEYAIDDEDGPVGTAVVGGHVYEGDAIEALDGLYVFGERARADTDHPRDGRLFAAAPDADASDADAPGGVAARDWEPVEIAVAGSEDGRLHRFVRQFGRGPDGEIYVLVDERAAPEDETGAVLRLVDPADGEDVDPPRSV